MSQTKPAPSLGDPADAPPLDRTISPIAGRLAAGGRGKLLTFAGLLAGCAVFTLASWSSGRPRTAPPASPTRQVVAFEPAAPAPSLAHPGPAPPRLSPEDPRVPAIDPAATDPDAPSAPPRTGPATPRAAPLMAYSRSAPEGLPDVRPPTPEGAAKQAAPTALDQLRQGSRIGRASAHSVGDRNFLILAGTVIPCVLQTALDSTVPGYASCLVPTDIYSDNGAVVLLEKGARVLGEYRPGIRQGQRRIFVLWTRAITPGGVAIDLASPASDALGRAGFDGAVDTHFWDRFGAAVLLSVVDDGTYALTDRAGRSGAARLPSDAAGLAVAQGGDVGPTLRKAPGSEVAIFAAEDFDFSGVYGLKARAP